MNDEILKEVESIVNFIKESKDYQDYQYLYKKLKEHDQAIELMNEIKTIQKQIVRLEAEKKDVSHLEKQIQNKEHQLKEIPLYVEFITKQETLNEYFQLIKQRLDDYFFQKLNIIK